MDEQLDFLVRHGYSLLFAWVFLEQLGLPVPSAPLLLAAGALAGAGKMSLSLAVAIPSLAAVAGDVAWFDMGRCRGARVLAVALQNLTGAGFVRSPHSGHL